MDQDNLKDLLEKVRTGETPVAQAADLLGKQKVENLGYAQVDHGRASRCGFPEVVFCQGKEPAQAAAIGAKIYAHAGKVLFTRATSELFAQVRKTIPNALWHQSARCITAQGNNENLPGQGLVLILCAGTADLPVAEEAKVTATIAGARVETIYDVGVAGIHRLLQHQEKLRQARVLVVVAGMEGALPSVVAGLVDRPVVAVPTSVGYGASFGGLSALLTMLNSCAAGIAVVNIDNGFGGGYMASLINRDAPS